VFTQFPNLSEPTGRRFSTWISALVILCFLVLSSGCNRFHKERHETVYVWTQQVYLRDRVAAVSNRVAEVVNGQPLEVLETGRRFLKVKTQKNEIGWIPDRAVIDSKTYDAFVQLASQHRQDPVIATASLRDDIYLHLSPGRDTDRFYLLAGNVKVQLLVRASVPKAPAPGFSVPVRPPLAAPSATVTSPAPASAKQPPAHQPTPAQAKPIPSTPEAPLVVMEDWWLVRDGQGRTGWLLASRMDVDAPDEIAQYAEGQRIVGAYVIAKVTDSEASTPNHEVPEYVTALSPPKSGLPFDFDQIRVFTWSLKHHRYETAFRLRPVQGYLPVSITSEPAPGGSEPVFTFQISETQNLAVNPDSGIARPVAPRTISYALRETLVRRVGADLGPISSTHSAGEKPKSGKAAKAAKSHKPTKSTKSVKKHSK
jgi:hypothetical protein